MIPDRKAIKDLDIQTGMESAYTANTTISPGKM